MEVESQMKKDLHKDAMNMLLATSRTFYIPISRLSDGLKEAVGSAYLCMRAIDEIEDHPQFDSEMKINLLRSIGTILQKKDLGDTELEIELKEVFAPYHSILPEVTLRMADWAKFAPEPVRPDIYHWTGIMAEGMADWVSRKWEIHTKEDLDQYTYYVAGLVGLLLSDLWKWYDGTESDEDLAVAYGRGLQAVNIIRNREEDLLRGVDFYPDGWEFKDMLSYARQNLAKADIYIDNIQSKTILDFCKIPLVLAYGTLDALESGKEKLSRLQVINLVRKATK